MSTIRDVAIIRIGRQECTVEALTAAVALQAAADKIGALAIRVFDAITDAFNLVADALARVIPALTEFFETVAEVTAAKTQPYWARGNEFVRRRTRRLRR